MGILRNIGQLATCASDATQGGAHVVAHAAIVWSGDEITWVGEEKNLPPMTDHDEHDAGGRLVIPGLIDCHTHLAFGGWRADEFEERIRGSSYLEIARRGGGIRSTVRDTRRAEADHLFDRVRRHAAEMLELGVTTIECKSGYGLTLEDELKLLKVYRRLSMDGPQRIVSTFLGAHTVPPEFDGRRAEYVDLVCDVMIPRVAREKLASFCDVFVEESAFSLKEGERILKTGRQHGLGAKVHADQLTSCGGAELAASVGAVSADHLEQTSTVGIRAMAREGVVAVSLPIASLYLGVKPLDGRRFIEAGVSVAVATDFNPGSAPSYHLPMALMLACNMNRLTPAQALLAGTRNAARAIGMSDTVGSIEAGKKADLALLDAESVNHWLYNFRPNAVAATFVGGRLASGQL
ncbi:MAG: imidazolonepropionase [Rhodothermia bacterium]|nr:imidazolonepropionase [Rhodothermia bacterium]